MLSRIRLIPLPIAQLRYVTAGCLIVYHSPLDNASHLGQVVFIRFNDFTHNIINCKVRRVAVPTGNIIEEEIKQEQIERIITSISR